jgi:hypothetical protein
VSSVVLFNTARPGAFASVRSGHSRRLVFAEHGGSSVLWRACAGTATSQSRCAGSRQFAAPATRAAKVGQGAWVGTCMAAAREASQRRCLTPRSSGAPTAWRLARAAVLFIIYRAGQAPHRRCPLNSHVRQHSERSSRQRTRSTRTRSRRRQLIRSASFAGTAGSG